MYVFILLFFRGFLKRPLPVARCELRVDIKMPVDNIKMPVDDTKTPVDIKTPVGKNDQRQKTPVANIKMPVANIKTPVANIKTPVVDIKMPVANIKMPVAR